MRVPLGGKQYVVFAAAWHAAMAARVVELGWMVVWVRQSPVICISIRNRFSESGRVVTDLER